MPPIRCGQTVSTVIAGNNDFRPYMLDLRNANGNTQILLSTRNSPVMDPDLCLFREYIDDDQSKDAPGPPSYCHCARVTVAVALAPEPLGFGTTHWLTGRPRTNILRRYA